MSSRSATGCALFVVALALPRAAVADDTHYQDYPLGGRAVGLGGAFVALGDDPSGIVYNPAGIVDATKTSVQISTTLYGLEIADSFFAAVERATDLQTVFTELNVIPTSASFTSALGELGPDGRPVQSYGFGAFVPSFRSINARSLASIPEDQTFGRCRQLAYQRNLLDRTFQFGAAYAQRIDELWRMGLSALLSYRALRDQEETSCFNGLVEQNSAFASAQTDLDMGVASLQVGLGLKVELGGGWILGGTITSPSIRVFDTGSLRVSRNSADPSTTSSEFVLRELGGIEVDTRVGASLKAGVAYLVPKKLTFVGDVSVMMPTRYDLFELPASASDLRDAITLVSDIERRLVINVNTGVEYLVSKPFSVSAGLFTNFSSAPPIEGSIGDRLNESSLPQVHAYGGSLVLGFFSEHTLSRVGLTLSYGDGRDVVPRYAGLAALGQDTEWVTVEYSQLFLFLFLSSTFRY
ncbi:hypothetical protein L6R52_38065 [Myxococcota bacterium]|nr:hypothetical protein [Myxococcota bacterium]